MLTSRLPLDRAQAEPPSYSGLQVVIVDDDPATIERLRLSLSCIPRVAAIHEARTLAELKQITRSQKLDVVIVDVELGPCSTLDELCRLSDPQPVLILHARSGEKAAEAFDASAVDFLLKPVAFDRLSRAIDRAERHLWNRSSRDRFAEIEARLNEVLATSDHKPSHGRQYVWRKHAGELLQLAVDEVEWFQAAGDYVIAHTANESHFLSESVTNLHERLAGDEVVRVHRCSIINLQHVQRLRRRRPRGYSIILKSGRQVAVGPKYETNVLENLHAGRWR